MSKEHDDIKIIFTKISCLNGESTKEEIAEILSIMHPLKDFDDQQLLQIIHEHLATIPAEDQEISYSHAGTIHELMLQQLISKLLELNQDSLLMQVFITESPTVGEWLVQNTTVEEWLEQNTTPPTTSSIVDYAIPCFLQ